MKMQPLLRIAAAVSITFACSLLFAGQGFAQSRSGLNGNYEFILHGHNPECIHSNGPGNQLGIRPSPPYTCAIVNVSPDGIVPNIYFLSINGDCVKAYADGNVKLTSGGCDPTDSADVWEQTATNPPSYRFENYMYGLWMQTHYSTSGSKVYIGKGGYNDWDLNP